MSALAQSNFPIRPIHNTGLNSTQSPEVPTWVLRKVATLPSHFWCTCEDILGGLFVYVRYICFHLNCYLGLLMLSTFPLQPPSYSKRRILLPIGASLPYTSSRRFFLILLVGFLHCLSTCPNLLRRVRFPVALLSIGVSTQHQRLCYISTFGEAGAREYSLTQCTFTDMPIYSTDWKGQIRPKNTHWSRRYRRP